MKTMSRFIEVVAVVSTMLGVLALPALAQPAIVIFKGRAIVCGQTVAGKPAAPETQCPSGRGKDQGLYLIGQPGGPNHPTLGIRTDPTDTRKWTNRTGNYQFFSGPLNIPGGDPRPADNCFYINPLDPDFASATAGGGKRCAIDASGKLLPVPVGPLQIGAACGVSQGAQGAGTLTTFNSPTNGVATLSNVGWATSAGGTLPVTGSYTITQAGSGKKNTAPLGALVGVVQAQGGAPCVKSPATGKTGASEFNVVGIFAAL